MRIYDFRKTKMTFTTHFINRYFERVLKLRIESKYSEATSIVLSDMFNRFSLNEYAAYEKFVGKNIENLTMPIGIHRIIMKNDTAITVY